MSNTPKNSVFLTNDESAFAVNALSGRKVVFSRRVHANYFVDVEKRYADGVVMLFGNNADTIKKLLKEYSVDYLFIDSMLFRNGIIINPKYEDYLRENGIIFAKGNARLDPSTALARSYPSLIIPPAKTPANISLIKYNMTTLYQNFFVNSKQIGAQIFKIK